MTASHSDRAEGEEAVVTSTEILADLSSLFREVLASDAWGRLLVELLSDPGRGLVVADVFVEEIVGDEQRVDLAFGSEQARALMPVVARASEALCALEGLDAGEVGGATFVRTDDSGALAFLPGRVRAPSRSLDDRRGELLARLEDKARGMRDRYGLDAGSNLAVDLDEGTIALADSGASSQRLRGRHAIIGSYAWARRSWAWGAQNPSIPEASRRRSAALLDAVRDRSLWEVSTAGFQTDEPTAWLLAALVVEASDLIGATRVDLGDEGFVILGIFELERDRS